jgi:hypothetical protein
VENWNNYLDNSGQNANEVKESFTI